MNKFTIGLSMAALLIAGGAHAAPAEREKSDADGNGVVTRAEAEAAAAANFVRMDANKDGKLDQADRVARAQAMKASMFEQLDTDRDGQISKVEFIADKGPNDRGGDPTGKRDHAGRMAMGEASKDGGGYHGRRGGRHGGAMGLKMADADKNGAVSQAEFAAAALKRFEAVDANKDGQITKEERQAAHEQMKARWQQNRTEKAAG